MNNKNGVFGRLAGFAEDKGFYIILMLCVLAIGISGYVLFFFPDGNKGGELGMEPGIETGLPTAEDVRPYEPRIPEVTVKLEDPEPEPPKSASAQVSVPELPRETIKAAAPATASEPEPAEPTWIFGRSPAYSMPVSGRVIRGFSMDKLIYDRTMDDWRTHNGIDISCAEGDAVTAIASGTVEQVYEDGLLGGVVVLDHGDGLKSIYCGLAQNTTMAKGMAIKAGEAIGTSGGTMKTESLMEAHVHLSVMKNGEYIDPESLKLK